MLKARSIKHILKFKKPGGTSRGVLQQKDSWFVIVWDDENPQKKGIGECGIIPGLSIDDRPDFEDKLSKIIKEIEYFEYLEGNDLADYPSIRFGFETALLDLKSEQERILFPTAFTRGQEGININGLIWMGSFDFMKKQINEKINAGFNCIKLKIGAIDFKEELRLLSLIRNEYSVKDLELRVDANGAFLPEDALEKLNRLAEFDLHSIEQPIRVKQVDEMAELCRNSPIPVALDEELIGVTEIEDMRRMLQQIHPQYLILKPGLLGGFKQCELFISEAEKLNINWWITSALESNIGLNAIAQWTYVQKSSLPQGLGTGQLYTNNIPSPLEIRKDVLYYNPVNKWKLNFL